MIAASVGFQCPDDVRAGQQGIRPARTSLGGRVSTQGQLSGAAVSIVLVGLNVAVYVVGLSRLGLDERFGNLALSLSSDGSQLIGVAEGQWYRLVTAAFLHAGLFHLLTNMLALITVGPQLEAALGRVRFLTLYLLSALGGSTLSFVVSDPNQLGVGASGAIFGLFGAYYVLVRRLGGDTGTILVLIGVNLVITFAVPIIDWRAHVGGLVTGSLLAVALVYAPRGPRQAPLQAAGCAAVLAVLVGAVLWRTSALTGALTPG